HPVHARNQNGIFVLLLVQREHPPEAADVAQHALGKRLVCQVFDPLLYALGAVNVDAGSGVAGRLVGGKRLFGGIHPVRRRSVSNMIAETQDSTAILTSAQEPTTEPA